MGPHKPGCQYYLEGGEVAPPMGTPIPTKPVHPSITLGHAAVQHGLLGILQDVGGQSLASPEKHRKKLDQVKGQVVGGQVENAIDTLHDHPLTGRIPRSKLEPIVHRLAPELAAKDNDPGAFRSSVDYLHSAIKGNDTLKSHMGTFFDPQKANARVEPDDDHRKQLDDLLKWTQESPQALLDVGGQLGYYLPEHAAEVGALAQRATEYLNTLRPKERQINPLDPPIPPDPNSMQQFDRHLDLAQNPMLLLQHAREGSLIPSDIKTVQFLYPQLYQSMQSKAAEALIEAKTKNKEIPYHQGISLGMLLGQPLDGSSTPAGMQAIMQANSGEQNPQPQQPQPKKKSGDRATGVMLKQIDKTDQLSQTPIDSRLIGQQTE